MENKSPSGGGQSYPPFSCEYSPNVPKLLAQLGCTLALSTYQAGKLVFISPRDERTLLQLPRTFRKPMGIAVQKNKMAIATLDEVLVLANSPELAYHYPKKTQTYDAMYMPRATYYTGQLDIHDLEWGQEGLYAVNTSFSCICKIDEQFSFTPLWQPSFISKLAHEDRCHLNGMAMEDHKPRYVTAFNQGDRPKSWRDNITNSGILMDITDNSILSEALPMPHSPRLYDGRLFLLLSATGELVEIDVTSGSKETICQLDGFVRGLDKYGDYLFIGLSKLRKRSSTFSKLRFSHQADQAGVVIVHLPSGKKVGRIRYLNSVEEIYDVKILPGTLRPNVLNTEKPEHKLGLVIPGTTYWAGKEK